MSALPLPVDCRAFVLFGATGDLARRKLLPALYEMSRSRMLPREGQIIGYARTPPERGDFAYAIRNRGKREEGRGHNGTYQQWSVVLPKKKPAARRRIRHKLVDH